eukprot:CAMPEP_0177676078 /NCGR_PEP_ID=MMETSP0447-20121125/27572_1 /TAXON_ID=0 /ORGANISM="Stygamoeba regulata, Strain BSH-02190019" /LENGTH=785 /DNA_ID=CAMNT_0019184567 /DNA_START=115 /DNA_END=2473 /DNA_ORIENTATION=+
MQRHPPLNEQPQHQIRTKNKNKKGILKKERQQVKAQKLARQQLQQRTTANGTKSSIKGIANDELFDTFLTHFFSWTPESIHHPFEVCVPTALRFSSLTAYYDAFKELNWEEMREEVRTEYHMRQHYPTGNHALKSTSASTTTTTSTGSLGNEVLTFVACEKTSSIKKKKKTIRIEKAAIWERLFCDYLRDPSIHHTCHTFEVFVVVVREVPYFVLIDFKENNKCELIGPKLLTQQLPRGTTFKARYLFGATSYWRVYQSCILQAMPLFMDEVVDPRPEAYHLDRYTDTFAGSLNVSQSNAISPIIAADKGIFMIQGPPGTGKTTTVVELLFHLSRDRSVLACAPTNKAIMDACRIYPEVPVVFYGVSAEVDEEDTLVHEVHVPPKWRSIAITALRDLHAALVSKLSLSFVNQKWHQFYKVCVVKIQQRLQHISLPPHIASFFPTLTAPTCPPYSTVQALSAFFEGDGASGIDLEKVYTDNSLIKFSTLCTTGRLSHSNKTSKIPPGTIDCLVVDEAASTKESEIFIPFRFLPKMCVLVGDHKQLPALIKSPINKEARYERSMMERLTYLQMKPRMLTIQYRMHPDIRAWPGKQFYDNLLTDGTGMADKRTIPACFHTTPFLKPYCFVNVDGRDEKWEQSRCNKAEAQALVSVATQLIHVIEHNNLGWNIGVICFYQGQATLLRRLLTPYSNTKKCVTSVATVDSFQGEECDIILISFTRANVNCEIGFLNDSRRINVAVTRAKRMLLMFGDKRTLSRSSPLLIDLISHAKSTKTYVDFSDLEQLQ